MKLGILKAITSALGKRKAAGSVSSSGSGLEKRCVHVHGLVSSWDLHDWTTGQRIYPDSELFISPTLPLLRCHTHCHVVGSSHTSLEPFVHREGKLRRMCVIPFSKFKTWPFGITLFL